MSEKLYRELVFGAVLLILALAGCAHLPMSTALPGVPVCSSEVVAAIRTENVCDGSFTADGLACVACAGGEACYDASHVLYCVEGGCKTDARCQVRP